MPHPFTLDYPWSLAVFQVVFVMPVFEVSSDSPVPENKEQMMKLLKKQKAVVSHESSCPACQKFPFLEEWMSETTGNLEGGEVIDTMSVLGQTYRTLPYRSWEPIHVGTDQDPMYDERLSWEGMRDKMTQVLRKFFLHVEAKIFFFLADVHTFYNFQFLFNTRNSRLQFKKQ